MASADVIMDYSTLEGIARDLVEIQRDFEDARSELHNLVTSTEGIWKGSAQTEFKVAYHKVKPKLERISEFIGNYAKAIETTTNEQREYDDRKSKKIDGLSF